MREQKQQQLFGWVGLCQRFSPTNGKLPSEDYGKPKRCLIGLSSGWDYGQA